MFGVLQILLWLEKCFVAAQFFSLPQITIVHLQCSLVIFVTDDSEDEKEDHKNVRQQRQAASKAASKQREMLMDDVGSEEEDEEEEEASFQESKWGWLAHKHTENRNGVDKLLLNLLWCPG